MIRNLRFRSTASLALNNNRQRNRPRALRWFVLSLFLATSSLYGAFQLQRGDGHLRVTPPSAAPLPLPISASEPEGPDLLAIEPTTPLPEESVAIIDTPKEDIVPAEPPAPLSATPDYSDRWLVHKIQPGDTISGIFEGLGLGASLLQQVLHCGTPAKQLANIKPGQTLRIRFDWEGEFAELLYQVGPTQKLRITRDDDELAAVIQERDTEIRKNQAFGVIESSLIGSAKKAGLSERLTMNLARIFRWDIDFALEVRSGDRFSVVYSEEWIDDKKLRDGHILAAEFVNRGKTYRAVRFEDASGKAGYYTPEGKSLKKEFLRTPLKFTRISSKFTKRRWHPVLKRWRSHKGVDYAAPTGTPVKAAGDAKVTFVGRKGGYGKVIYLQHQGKHTTVYGHLSRFAKGIKEGMRVKQGELIGYVGQTGLASGPHLHYEFRVNGEHRNPLKVTKLGPASIAKKYRHDFKKSTGPLLARLDSMSRTKLADAR